MFGWRRRREREAAERAAETELDRVDGSDLAGPFDSEEAPADELARLDLGSVRVPVPDGAQLQVEVDPAGPVRAVHVVTPIGRLTVNAYAAPRSGGLWREVSKELIEQLRSDGARVIRERGEWGEELVASSPEVALRFVGVDGPRWLLRAVAAGPAQHAAELAELLRDTVRDTVVVRGKEPLPVRTPLPVELPEAIAQHIRQAQEGHTIHEAEQMR
ncbi:hypothetical protein GCM10012275_27610 [Longimycelium tulufanense]|uniref:DUF3710 domain-containing protein n=1 Tax=Longimycelium tulufanense TaxID=907463 RepID=A0A8J3CCT7_9PSEU|nr:DUF3710 domain-containing protein [Longimycelium tulufanense]GGM55006.1 hypothetical protein GCM10012275_27610 [Longimycelium tulufanense]